MLIHIPYSPGVCITENTTPVWRKSKSVDNGQIHILRPVADPFLDHVGSFVDGPGKHPIYNLLKGHGFGPNAILFQIVLDHCHHFWVRDGLFSTVVKPARSGFSSVTSSLIDSFVKRIRLPSLSECFFKGLHHMIVDIHSCQIAEGGRTHGEPEIQHSL